MTGPAEGGVMLEITGAFPFTASAASAAVVRPKKADPATPNLMSPFMDCLQFSCTLVGWTFEKSLVDLQTAERETWNALQVTNKTDKTTVTVEIENISIKLERY